MWLGLLLAPVLKVTPEISAMRTSLVLTKGSHMMNIGAGFVPTEPDSSVTFNQHAPMPLLSLLSNERRKERRLEEWAKRE